MRLVSLREKGDTIVEVLFAVLVMSVVIGASYGLASRSLKGTRVAQERGEALKIAEAQAERLKYLATSNPTAVFGGALDGPIFCIGASNTSPDSRHKFLNFTTYGASIKPLAIDNLLATEYPPLCVVDNDTTNDYPSDPIAGDNRYNVLMDKQGNNFDIYVRWFSLSGLGKEEVKLSYRLYP